MASQLPHDVQVSTTARLHMGFLDLNGGYGRRFGSLGLSLEHPATCFTALRSDGFEAQGPGAERAVSCARQFASRAGIRGGVRLALESTIPEHAGLGSGTQLAMAVGVAMARLYGLPMNDREVAALTERGARSGIGIGAFECGGFLVDGGRGERTVVPPILARMDFPEEWRVLLVFDHAATGVHGSQEISAFRTLPPFPADAAAMVCRRVLMQALPAVAERNLAVFGEAIHEIQCLLGDHFAAAQGGGRYTSPQVSEVLESLRGEGVGCVGQSSWGPTGFAVVGNESEGRMLQQSLALRYAHHAGLRFVLCKARNQGSEVQVNYQENQAGPVLATG